MPVPAYFDTSALVKLYLQESYSREVGELYHQSDAVACHELGFVEGRAALAAAQRSGRINAEEHRRLVQDFIQDWEVGISPVSTNPALLLRAAELAEGFALRGFDAVHLAGAERIFRTVPSTIFLSFDVALNRAARLLGFPLPNFVPQ